MPGALTMRGAGDAVCAGDIGGLAGGFTSGCAGLPALPDSQSRSDCDAEPDLAADLSPGGLFVTKPGYAT